MYLWAVLIGCGLIRSIPKVTSVCPTDCQACIEYGAVSICTSCSTGYWPSGSSCQPCSNNCATCSNASSCSTCKPGFYSPHTTCHLQCSTKCLDGLCDDITGHCIKCPSGSYGYDCDRDCGLCKNGQCDLRKCTDGCKSGYWQYKNGNLIECRACKDNCSSCDGWTTCNVCNDGTYLSQYSATQNYCVLCPSTCEQCSTFISCSQCKPGYFGTACEFMCSSIIVGCKVCDFDVVLKVTCSQCDNGWTLHVNVCMEAAHQCPIKCKSCAQNNVCEICKTGWVGELCDRSCRGIPNCVACHEAGGSIECNLCNDGYGILNGECSVTTTRTKAVQSTSAYAPAQTKRTAVLPTMTISDQPLSEYSTPMPQSQNARFQTSAFVIGLVAGIGICMCANLLAVLVWFLRRRKRRQKSTTSRQNEPLYENSFAANEPHSTTMNTDAPNQENMQQMRAVDEHDSEPVEDKQNLTAL